MKKRILFVHHASVIGGASFCMLNIIKNIDRNKFEPLVLLRTTGPLVDELEKLNIKVFYLPSLGEFVYMRSLFSRISIISNLKILRSKKPFIELLQREKIDIVYLNNMMIFHFLKAAKQAGCKTILHVREHVPLDRYKLKLRWARNQVDNYCDQLVAINHYSASIFPDKDATIIYDWIDMKSRYKKMPFNDIFGEDMSGKKVLLFTGGFDPIKGLACVVDCFTKDLKGDEYRLLILGKHTEKSINGLKGVIKNVLKMLGRDFGERLQCMIEADKRIKCIPPLYELSHLIEQSHCYVSYFTKPHANLALAENIILKNPSIVAETEESLEYTNNGEYAMLVKPNDRDEFSAKLILFLSNINEWEKAAEKGADPLLNKFDKSGNVSRLESLLESI